MKRYKSKKQQRAYARKYYQEHREKILNYVKSRYVRVTGGKCKICGKDLSDMPNGIYKYCNECMEDKNKVSRQARWYRKHSLELKLKRKSQRRVKK